MRIRLDLNRPGNPGELPGKPGRFNRLSARREEDFLAAVRRSRRLHRPWVYPPSTREEFNEDPRRVRRPSQQSKLVIHVDTGDLVGVVNLNEIVRGHAPR